MPAISRATLPQEFFDITSAQLLIQPEPQYLHAGLLMNALNAELDVQAKIGLPIQGREFGGSGPPYMGLEMMQRIFEAEGPGPDLIYKDAIKVVVELGKDQVGHTIRMNRPQFVNSTYTRASRRIPVGQTISVSPLAVSSEQVSITIDRFGGPFDAVAGQVRPLAVERFDASRSVHSMAAIRELHLQRDFHRTIDTFGVQLFDQVDATTGIIRPDGMTNDNTSVTAGDFPMSYAVLRRTQRSLEEAHIPTFSNGRYLAVLTPLQTEQLERDPEYARLARYDERFNPLFFKSYVNTVGAFDILKSTTLTRSTNVNSVEIQYGQAFGPGAIGCGAGEMPRTTHNTQDNYGETALVIWLWYAGFEVLDDRFLRSIRTS